MDLIFFVVVSLFLKISINLTFILSDFSAAAVVGKLFERERYYFALTFHSS